MAKTKARAKKKSKAAESGTSSPSAQSTATTVPPTTTIHEIISNRSTKTMSEISSCHSSTAAIPVLDSNQMLTKIMSALKILDNTKGNITKENTETIIEVLHSVNHFLQTSERLYTEMKNLTTRLNMVQDKLTVAKQQLESLEK